MWYRNREALSLIGRGYLPWFVALNLGWEIVQLPLYTIWHDASAGYLAFAVLHCTAGDLLIGSAALALALLATRAGAPSQWPWPGVMLITTTIGVGYTFVSEWMNTSIKQSWSYSNLMPAFDIGSVTVGLSPVAQWLVLPTLALTIARRSLKS